MPEVSLVAILDADKEGFLRSEQVADSDHWPGGTEREGASAILYADRLGRDRCGRAIGETDRRRAINSWRIIRHRGLCR